jgi:hypothetical protein
MNRQADHILLSAPSRSEARPNSLPLGAANQEAISYHGFCTCFCGLRVSFVGSGGVSLNKKSFPLRSKCAGCALCLQQSNFSDSRDGFCFGLCLAAEAKAEKSLVRVSSPLRSLALPVSDVRIGDGEPVRRSRLEDCWYVLPGGRTA